MMEEHKQILFFHSETCRPCKGIEALLERLKKEGSTVPVRTIDVDHDLTGAARRYGVSSTPTAILLGDTVKVLTGNSSDVMRQIKEFAKC